MHFTCFFLSRSPLLKSPIPSALPCLCEGSHPPTSCPSIPLHWGIKHPQAQGLLFPLMSNKAILCHICPGSFHVYSLVCVPAPGSTRESGLLTLLLHPWGCKPPQLFQSLLQLLHLGLLTSVNLNHNNSHQENWKETFILRINHKIKS